MPKINISRDHGLSLPQACAIALDWLQAAHRDFGIDTNEVLAESPSRVFHFKRSGLHGSLQVTASQFVLEVSLGLLLGSFKDRIEAELSRNLEIRLMDIPTSANGDDPTAANTP